MAEAGAVTVTVTVLTHRGAQRPHNEDAVVVGSCTFASVSSRQPHVVAVPLSEPVLIAVADGLGGHAAGEVASAHTVQRLATLAGSLTSKEAISSTLQLISDELTALGEANPEQQEMGTTIVGLMLTPERTLWFNVGDSRAYSLAGGYLGQLSIDDTPAAMFTEPGEVPPPTGIVTQVLGGSAAMLYPHTGVEPVVEGRVYLLCSDGLSDLVPLEDIERILAARPAPAIAAKELWAAAMNAGGRDNITIVLVQFAR